MPDRPILFSAQMVRALLEGRKTQTRRILKPQPRDWQVAVIDIGRPMRCEETGKWGQVETVWSGPMVCGMCEPHHEEWHPIKTPLIGDRLWVRETWSQACELDEDDKPCTELMPYYRADGEPFDRYLDPETDEWRDGIKWVPSIFMPRRLSRITLTLTDVRVQRLQDISEEDAEAEGIPAPYLGDGDAPFTEQPVMVSRVMQFRNLWNQLHGAGAWDENSWVVTLTFGVERKNIDA